MPASLPLDSPRWATLRTLPGDASEVPRLINTLQGQARLTDSLPLSQLHRLLYEQFSFSEAAYAATPYLVEIAERVPVEDRAELLIRLGCTAGARVVTSPPPPADLREAFQSALAAAEALCIRSLTETRWDLDLAYHLSVACFGLAGHSLGLLVMDNLFPFGKAESSAFCPNCDRAVKVAVFETGLVVIEPGSRDYPPPPPSRPPEPPIVAGGEARTPNPWAILADTLQEHVRLSPVAEDVVPHSAAAIGLARIGVTPDSSPTAAFSLLGMMLVINGFVGPAYRYFHAIDHIACTNCKSRFRFADHWAGLPKKA